MCLCLPELCELCSPKMFPMTSLREEAWHWHACFVDAQLFTSCRGFKWAVDIGPLSVLIGDMVLCHNSVNNSSIFMITIKFFPYFPQHAICTSHWLRSNELKIFFFVEIYSYMHGHLETCASNQPIPSLPISCHDIHAAMPRKKRKHDTIPNYDNLLCDEDQAAPISRSALNEATWYSTNKEGCQQDESTAVME